MDILDLQFLHLPPRNNQEKIGINSSGESFVWHESHLDRVKIKSSWLAILNEDA